MAEGVKDIKLNTDNDLFINATIGDFDLNESDFEHAKDLIFSYAGHWKEYPLLGVGVNRYINAPKSEKQALRQLIKSELNADGLRVQYLNIDENFEIEIDVERVRNG